MALVGTSNRGSRAAGARSGILLIVLLALGLATAASASAAPELSFTEVGHVPATVNWGDELVQYPVKVKNVGADPTTAPISVSVALPAGLSFAGSFNSNNPGDPWACQISTNTCTTATVLAPGAELPLLTVNAWIFPDQAPSTVTASFTASGGGAALGVVQQHAFTRGPEVPFGLTGFTARAEDAVGSDYTQAGGHPFRGTTAFAFATHLSPAGAQLPVENVRDAVLNLPPGFGLNPEAVPGPGCTVGEVEAKSCPDVYAIGGVKINVVSENENQLGNSLALLFKVQSERGYPAAFAFLGVTEGSRLTYVLRGKVRSNGDYGITALAPLPPQQPQLVAVEFARICGFGVNTKAGAGFSGGREFASCRTEEEAVPGAVPAVTNPTRCEGPAPSTSLEVDSFQSPGAKNAEGFPLAGDSNWKSRVAVAPVTTGCAALTEAWVGQGPDPTAPELTMQPDSSQAAAPAGYSTHLEIPQEGTVTVGGTGTAHLKDTIVRLPAGLALNPSAANGLGACSEAQAGYLGNQFPSPNPIHFSTTSPGCPDDSKLGTVRVSTPLLDSPLPGAIYLAAQDENPFGTRFAVYLVIDDPDIGVKATLAGKIVLNQQSGQVTATFANNPQVPLEDLDVRFFGGPRASLANPDVCGTYTTETDLTPWSAADPEQPLDSEIAHSSDPITIDSPPTGASSCAATKAARPFALGFSAGVTNPTAGAHSPFTLRITRPDGSQELNTVSVTTPPGFAATLRGVTMCPEAAIAAAAAAGRTGAAELANPSCPASSQIGTTTIGAGVGSNPYYVKTGKAYLTGPYKGAPIGLAFVVPAVAGPFDLGVQVVRTALRVNPKTAQITAESDPIPQILEGIPLQIRDVRVDVDRPGFALNPTSCEVMGISGQVTGGSGAAASVASRFQVGNCAALGFKPNVKLQLHGGTRRGAYQRVVATVTAREGDANIARAAVTFPHSAFLAQEHIRTVCTRVQFAANACPQGSVYGYATAITPLLDQPVQGPVYLRSNPEQELPDLVAALRGPDTQPIEVELSGRTDSKNEGIRNTFDIVPDAPVSKFTLQLKGGSKSLIVNSRNLCNGVQRATVRMTGQNGKQRNFRPVVNNDCGKKKNAKSSKKGSADRRGRGSAGQARLHR